MQQVLLFGIGLAAGVYGVTSALHLLNRSSDLAVAGGYLILLLIFAGLAEWIRRHRRGK
jgi:hypothetical protein